MKIIKPYAKIVAFNGTDPDLYKDGSVERLIEAAGRVSHRSETDMSETSTSRFLKAVVMDHGDWSIVEHATAAVEFVVDRGITHELVRHRLFSYTQESTRFVNYAKKMPPSFIYPEVGVECPYCLSGKEPILEGSPSDGYEFYHATEEDLPECAYNRDWLMVIHEAGRGYQLLLDQKWKPQTARSVFPNALASKIIMTGNLRSWRHFFRMRTTKEAHPQMLEVTVPLLKQFQLDVPVLYGDIVPMERQVDNLKLPC